LCIDLQTLVYKASFLMITLENARSLYEATEKPDVSPANSDIDIEYAAKDLCFYFVCMRKYIQKDLDFVMCSIENNNAYS